MRERDGGWRIVNVGSTMNLVATPGCGQYTPSKHGLHGLTKTLAVELGSVGVTVNLLCLTGVDTHLASGTCDSRGDAPFDRSSVPSGAMSVLPDEGLLPL
jgi:NAD(P)-dependent dehydrogenase (short-subunit alcohol dehydrogenase family)